MNAQPNGMRIFLLVWFGQMISIIGSSLTSFGLGVWVYERTGSATEFAVIAVAAILPGIVIAPLAGAVVDRHDRRRLMILSDLCAALSTAAVAVLLVNNNLQIWHIYVTAIVSSSASAFQNPAYTASISQLVPKTHYGRAAGLITAAEGAAQIIAPALAGVLIGFIGLHGIIAVDFATFLFGVSVLLVVRFPAYTKTTNSENERKTSIWQEAGYGWRYMLERRGLLALMLFFAFINLTLSLVNQLLTPMVLSFSSPEGLGLIVSASGVGLMLGSAAMAVWGTPRRRILVIYGTGLLQGFTMIMMGWRESIALLATARFMALVVSPLVNGSAQVLLQRKVPVDMQGRVFSATRMLARASIPLAYLLSGPLADGVFQPMMTQNGALASSLGQIIGTSAGRGIALMYIVFGLVTLVGTLTAFLYKPMRNIERELPDVTPDDPPPPQVQAEAAARAPYALSPA
jgi:MFS transporter, DHA3 family, macrolide efflux protein